MLLVLFWGSAQIPFDVFFPFFSAGKLLPPSVCGPEMVQSAISSHACPTQTPNLFFGAH